MASDLSGTSYEARAYGNIPQGIVSYQAIPVKITTMYAYNNRLWKEASSDTCLLQINNKGEEQYYSTVRSGSTKREAAGGSMSWHRTYLGV